MTDGYFTAMAREVFSRAGGDPDNAGPLAEWAEEAKRIGDPKRGVIVAEDGQLVAATRYVADPGISAWYVAKEDSAQLGLFGNEVGLATAQLHRILGKRVIHVTMPEVTRGTGVRVQEPDPLAAVRQAAEESQAADAALRKAALEAHTAGQSPRHIADAAGVAHTTIYRWIKEDAPRRACTKRVVADALITPRPE